MGAYSDLRRDIVSHKGQHHDNERLCGKDIIPDEKRGYLNNQR